jgi:DNA (cytosine-5)-methyltransferase 1
MSKKTKLWFVKSKRAQTNDDFETWVEGGIVPTLNSFDIGDTRATVLIFEATRVDDVRIYESYCPTVATYWGTGGARVPYIFPLQGTIIGRSDTSGPQGKGYGEEGEVMFTLDRVSGHGIATDTTVRRLTPRECERLQGFPDDWTDGQADSHRYKQMGNAVAVPVVEWIINRIVNN